MTATFAPPPSFDTHLDLVGRLAQLLEHHHASSLLPGILTAAQPHLAATRQNTGDRAVMVDLQLLDRLAQLVEPARTHNLLLQILAELGPYLAAPDAAPIQTLDRTGEKVTLSDRERQVLGLIADGHTNAAAGRALYLSEDTVKTHVRTLLRKLGASDRAHAVGRAYQLGILVVRRRSAAAHRAPQAVA